jgi:hypothetical protein
MLGAIGVLIVLYLVCAELLKRVAVTPSATVVAPSKILSSQSSKLDPLI